MPLWADIRNVPPASPSTLAQKTIKHVVAKLEGGEAAGLSEIVELIQKLSTNAYETSVQELGHLIGKDVVVTAKVIAAANTIGYNPGGLEVSTITQAIHVIGFNKIRQLTVSLLLVENANRTLNPTEKREIGALALCSGLMAESVMSQRGTVPAEHAFICASLRNYGRLLMTTFMIEEYRRARIMATTGLAEDEAFKRVFGLTPLDLGYHLLASAHLPDPILKSLRAVPLGMIRNMTEQPELELLALADLSVRVCELALRPDIGAAEFTKQANALASRSGKVFGLDAEALVGLLQQTGQQLNEFAHTFGLNALAEQFTPRIDARVSGTDPLGYDPVRVAKRPPITSETVSEAEPIEAKSDSSLPVPAGSTETVAIPAPTASTAATSNPEATASSSPSPDTVGQEAAFQHAFQSGIEQLAGLLEEDPVDMRKVYDVILGAAQKGFSTTDVVIWVRDSTARKFSPTYGSGQFFEANKKSAFVKEEDRNVFGLCLQRLEDVLIYDASDPKIHAHLPPWIKTSKFASFVLLPIQENRRPFAVVLAGWPDKKTVGFSVAQIRHVRSMLKLAGTARKLAESR